MMVYKLPWDSQSSTALSRSQDQIKKDKDQSDGCWYAGRHKRSQSKPDVKELHRKYTPPQMSSEKDAIKVSTASWVTAADQLRLATHVHVPSAATWNVEPRPLHVSVVDSGDGKTEMWCLASIASTGLDAYCNVTWNAAGLKKII